MSRASSTARSVKRPPSRKAHPTTKQQVQQLLRDMPDDCTIEDIQYRLYVLEKARLGFQAIDDGKGIPHDQVKRRLQKWLTR